VSGAATPPRKEPEPEQPNGPRTPYPVDHPGIRNQPGTEPDYLPGKSVEDLPKL
jgi:hypothetical protein